MIPDLFLAIRQTFYTSLFVVFFSFIIKFENTKKNLLVKLSFVFLAYHECTNTLVHKKYLFAVADFLKRARGKTTIFPKSLI
jgi:hypothetical protein